MTTQTATSRALAITEILEHILVHLPPRDILLAQRISKSINSLITTSPTLQTAVGFRVSSSGHATETSTTTTTRWSEETEAACTININPFIFSTFPFLFSPHHRIPEDELEAWKQEFNVQEPPPEDAEKAVCLVEEEWKIRGQVFIMHRDDRPVGADKFPPPKDPQRKFWYSQWLFNAPAWRREDATWRRMQVTREPLRRLVLLESHSGQAGSTMSECILLLGEHPETTTAADTFFEARPKLNVDVRKENMRYRGVNAVPEEIPRRGWVKINDKPVDLTRWDGLPMSFVHDYLSALACRQQGPPDFRVSFHASYPPRPDPILKRLRRNSDKDVPVGMVERDGVGDGATMLIKTSWFHGCLTPTGPIFSQLTSLAAGHIETGPWVSVSNSLFL